jgi:hypothetical protein
MGKNKFPISKDFPDAKMFLLFCHCRLRNAKKNEKEVYTLQIPLGPIHTRHFDALYWDKMILKRYCNKKIL